MTTEYHYSECCGIEHDGSHTYALTCACGRVSKVTLQPPIHETVEISPAIVRPLEVDQEGNVTKEMQHLPAVTEERLLVPMETAEEARERALLHACKCGKDWPARLPTPMPMSPTRSK